MFGLVVLTIVDVILKLFAPKQIPANILESYLFVSARIVDNGVAVAPIHRIELRPGVWIVHTDKTMLGRYHEDFLGSSDSLKCAAAALLHFSC